MCLNIIMNALNHTKKVLNVVFEIFLVYPENKHIRVMGSELHL